MKRISAILFLISVLCLLCACGAEKQPEREQVQFGELGSVGELRGRTVVVSVFMDDNDNRWIWDENNAEDNRTAYTMLKYTGIACEWLQVNAAHLGSETEFVYDWSLDNELYTGTVMNLSLTDCMDEDLYLPICETIDEKVDSAHLKEKYAADNVAYLIFSNTTTENGVHCCSVSMEAGEEKPYPYEFSFIFARQDGEIISPGVIAHELLHLFGAPDLYYENERYGISRDYVEHLTEENSNDIMFKVSSYGETIVNGLSETDAYFLGLRETAKDCEEWGIHR